MGRESIRIACRYIANIQRELGHGVRPGVLAAALHGSTRRSVTEQGLELIDGHGAFSTRSRPAVRNMIGTLEAIQAIDTRTGLVEPGPLFDNLPDRRRQMSGTGRTIPIGAAELRAIRERESVLEQTLARLTGIDMTTIERIEKGETPLTTLEPDQIRQWAKTLGVNPARLTGETPQEGEGATTVIRRMRTERGWSCPQLAAHANVPYRSLRQYDSGERDTANMAAGILARVASRSTPAWKS